MPWCLFVIPCCTSDTLTINVRTLEIFEHLLTCVGFEEHLNVNLGT